MKEIESRLDLVAVVAVGVAPAGPWRLIVTADPRAPLKQAKFWNRMPIEVGAMLLLEAKTWAEQTRTGAAQLLRIDDADEAWVLGTADEMQRALAAAALGAGARCWDVYQHKARVEGIIEKELGL